MAKEKPGVMVYWETFDVLESLVDGDAKVMMSAIRQYSQYGALPDFTGNAILATLWILIRPKLDADSERYERTKESRIEAGRKGGLARASNTKQKLADEANASFDKQIKPTTTTTATTSTSTYPTATAPATAEPEKGIMDNGEKDNGRTFTSPPQSIFSEPVEVNPEFEEKRNKAIELLDFYGG